MKREDLVKSQLEEFVRKHDSEALISVIDEIVLSYMVSVLEELGSDAASEDAFDVEDFVEMMDAYIPSFADIESVSVTEWMFGLANKLANFEETIDATQCDDSVTTETAEPPQAAATDHLPADTSPLPIHSTNGYCRHRTTSTQSSHSFDRQSQEGSRTNSVSSDDQRSRSRKSSTRQSSVSETETETQCDGGVETGGAEDEHIQLLLEMFPAACSVEAEHCMALSGRDIEQAAQLMLYRQEVGENITPDASKSKPRRAGRKQVLPEALNDHDMKKHIVDKYSYVDIDDDKKEHKPVFKQGGSKKLVRYLDSRVVSTRGERFTEIKKPEDEEKMKKTYVNLKPARKYRFH